MDNKTSVVAGLLKVLGMAVLAVLLVSLAFFSGFGTAYLSQPTALGPQTAEAAPVATSSEQPPAFRVFWEAWRILERQFYRETPSDDARTYGAIRGLVESFDDPHTVFQDPKQSQLERTELQGEFEGIGAQVSMEDGNLTVVAPIKGSPAEAAGVKAGDIIIGVDGEPITGMSLMDAVLVIRGPRGTPVTLEIKRPGEPGTLTITVVRERIQIDTVTFRMLEDDIGYVELALFSQDAIRELREALKAVKDEGAKRLILDLRNNPGGFLQSALDVSDEFLKDGVIAYEVKGDGTEQVFRATKQGLAEDLPLVVLINQGSASASEIVAAAVQENGRGTLVGTETFGKGSVQLTFTLSDGSTLHVTIAQWLTPERVQLTDNPLQPDINVDVAEGQAQAGEDPQLERAIEFLVEGARAPHSREPVFAMDLDTVPGPLVGSQAQPLAESLAWVSELFQRLWSRRAL